MLAVKPMQTSDYGCFYFLFVALAVVALLIVVVVVVVVVAFVDIVHGQPSKQPASQNRPPPNRFSSRL